MTEKEKKKIYAKIKSMNARVYQLEITENQKDILIDALAFYDQDKEHELDDATYDNLRDQLDNAQFLGDSA